MPTEVEAAVALARDPTRQLELEQGGRDGARLATGLEQQLVRGPGTIGQECFESRFEPGRSSNLVRFPARGRSVTGRRRLARLRTAPGPLGRATVGGRVRREDVRSLDAEVFEQVPRRLDRPCALPKELIRPCREGPLDRPGNDEHLPSLVQRMPYGDE